MHHLMIVACGGQTRITLPAVGQDLAAGFHAGTDGGREHGRRGVRDTRQPDAANARSLGLGNDQHQRFAFRSPATFAGPCAPKVYLISLQRPRQAVAATPDHGATQLVQPAPSRRVADPQHPLDPQSAGSVLLIGHGPDRLKPQTQGQVSVRKKRTHCYREVVTTIGTTVERRIASADLGIGATRALRTVSGYSATPPHSPLWSGESS